MTRLSLVFVSLDFSRMASLQVNLSPAQRVHLSLPHACVQCHQQDRAKPWLGSIMETLKLLGRQDPVSLMVLTHQADAGDRVQRRYATPERNQPLI